MSATATSYPSPAEVARTLIRYPLRWIIPALLVATGTAVLAHLKQDTWEATQAMMIRNDAATNPEGPGRFRQVDDMKAVLETVLELSRSHAVLSAALVEVGPPAQVASSGKVTTTTTSSTTTSSVTPAASFPTAEDVADLADALKLTPPKGAEFGKSEVFYLKVKDPSRERALALAESISRQLQTRYNRLRDSRARSMLTELTEADRLATADLNEAIRHLTTLETEVGSDLAELRSLEQNSGDSDLRRETVEVENELRQAALAQNNLKQLLATLQAAHRDPNSLLAAPQGLLDTQPVLRRLKDGLVDAQLRTASLQGSMHAAHPLVQAAVESERLIRQQLREELTTATRGVEIDYQLALDRTERLEAHLDSIHDRLARIASLRAKYASLVADVAHRTRLAEETRRRLSETRHALAAAETSHLIDTVDQADTDTKPIGPSRKMILAAGVAGGLAAGIALVMLTIPAVVTAGATGVAAATDAQAGMNGSAGNVATTGPAAAGSLSSTGSSAATGSSSATGNRSLSLKQALAKVAA